MARGPFIDWTPKRDATIRRMWAEGCSVALIAWEIGLVEQRKAVWSHIRHALALPARRPTDGRYWRLKRRLPGRKSA